MVSSWVLIILYLTPKEVIRDETPDNRLRTLRESIGLPQAKFADMIGSTQFGIFRVRENRLINTFVNAVYSCDDKPVLNYNYQHGMQTITLKKVDDFFGSDLVGICPPNKYVNFYRITILIFCRRTR